MNSLYWIKDEDGNKVKFTFNWAQEELWREMWYQNIILKARQLGFTTFICLFMLDCALFNSNIEAGIIAHTIGDAGKIFENKIKFPYDNLPESIKATRPVNTDNANELALSNKSSIRVSTSMRSGTLQYLLITEFGKICARYPEKAKEIVTGTLNAVHQGNFVFIESTAEGRSGYFYQYCNTAQNLAKSETRLTPMDFKFHFAPWWRHPDYTLAADAVIPKNFQEYFEEVEGKIGRKLTEGQKRWYFKKYETQRDDMKREFPSTPEESFEAAIQGSYYKTEMAKAREGKRIRQVVHDPGLLVHTFWDLGMDDSMTITFMQFFGQEKRAINYYEFNGESIGHYIRKLTEYQKEFGYEYGEHWGPHDLGVRELMNDETLTRQQKAKDLGIEFNTVPRIRYQQDGIEAVRGILPTTWFDEEKCARLIDCLDNYRKEWNDKYGVFSDKPLHDEFSHGAKSFETVALALGMGAGNAAGTLTESDVKAKLRARGYRI